MEIDIASFGRAFLYLGIPFVLLIFYLQFRWAKTCDHNILVLIAELSGGGRYGLAPKEGGQVTIHNPTTDEDRTWMLNELSTIDITYPGVGFIPKALQKTIRLAIVNEGDMEPLLNRSPHRKKVASPDVIEFIKNIEAGEDAKKAIEIYLKDISTSPTRQMVVDPATVGSLMRSGVLKALATVSNDLLEQLKLMNAKLGKVAGANPLFIYIVGGLGIILIIFLTFQIMQVAPALQQAAETANKIDAIHKALGITP